MSRRSKSRTFDPYKPKKSKGKKRIKRNGMQKKAAMDAVTKMTKKGYG